MTRDGRIPARWGVQRGKHRDGGGFTGAVGAQQAEDLAFLDLKADAIDRDKISVFFDQIVKLVHHCSANDHGPRRGLPLAHGSDDLFAAWSGETARKGVTEEGVG